MRNWTQLANASQIIYGPLMFFTKLSILLFYLKVFVSSSKSKNFVLIHLLLWSNFLFYLAATIVEIFECTPRTKIWRLKESGKCVNINSLIISTAIINVISDFSILLLPMVCVWRLPMGTKQKLGLSSVFATGLLWINSRRAELKDWRLTDASGCISSIMRLIISIRNANGVDKTYEWFGEFLWT